MFAKFSEYCLKLTGCDAAKNLFGCLMERLNFRYLTDRFAARRILFIF